MVMIPFRKIRLIWQAAALVAVLLLHPLTSELCAGPFTLSHSGRLTNTDGSPVPGPVRIEARFFRSATGDDPVSVAPIALEEVTLIDGIFHISLPISEADSHLLFDGSGETWIELSVDGARQPRQRYGVVPYALKIPIDHQTLDYTDSGQLTLAPGAVTDQSI